MAVRGSLGRRSSLENRIRALSALNARCSDPKKHSQEAQDGHRRSTRVVEEMKRRRTAAAAQAKAPANNHKQYRRSQPAPAEAPQGPYRRNPAHTAPAAPARQPRQLQPSPRSVADRGVADRTDHRVGHHAAAAQRSEPRTGSRPEPWRQPPPRTHDTSSAPTRPPTHNVTPRTPRTAADHHRRPADATPRSTIATTFSSDSTAPGSPSIRRKHKSENSPPT